MNLLEVVRSAGSTGPRIGSPRDIFSSMEYTASGSYFAGAVLPLPIDWHGYLEVRRDHARKIIERGICLERLPTLRLRVPISARLRFEDGEWLAEAIDLPLYGNGENERQATDMLAREIESLWHDLNEDVAYGHEMLLALRYLQRVIVD